MEEYITLKVDMDPLEDHVKRICRRNLKKPAKICIKCPFLGPIIDIMDKYQWKYNKEAMAEPIKNYHAKYDD